MTERFARLRLKRVVFWPVATLVVLFLIALIPPRPSGGTTITAAAYVFYLVLLLAALTACRIAGISPAEVVGPVPTGPRPWLTATFLTPLLLLFSAVGLILTLAAGESVLPGWTSDQMSRGEERDILSRLERTHRILLALNITLLGPFVEEFVFRGMLLRRWFETRGLWPALLGSSAIFALLHPPSWIGSFTFGVVMGILYLWSKSLLLPVLAHVLNNALVTLVLLRAEGAADTPKPQERVLDGSGEWMVTAAMLVIIGALIVSVTTPLVRQVREQTAT
jgi:membrane protease YdiL (CAAX protease family)